MRVLLDAPDLIALFQRSDPLSPEQFEAWLHAREGTMVLTGTNVAEASALLLDAGKSSELRSLLRAVAAMPVCFLKEIAVFVEELGGALVAYGRGREPPPVAPYVTKWTDTLGISLGKSYASQSIPDTIAHLWRTAPEALRHFHRYQEILAEDSAADVSSLPPSAAGPHRAEAHFARYVERQLKLHGFALPPLGTAEFANWVYASPRRCPGLRLAFEVSRALIASGEMVASEGQLGGLGHLHAIPYVEAITMAGRLFRHCRAVSERLRQATAGVDYCGRIFPDLKSLLGR